MHCLLGQVRHRARDTHEQQCPPHVVTPPPPEPYTLSRTDRTPAHPNTHTASVITHTSSLSATARVIPTTIKFLLIYLGLSLKSVLQQFYPMLRYFTEVLELTATLQHYPHRLRCRHSKTEGRKEQRRPDSRLNPASHRLPASGRGRGREAGVLRSSSSQAKWESGCEVDSSEKHPLPADRTVSNSCPGSPGAGAPHSVFGRREG